MTDQEIDKWVEEHVKVSPMEKLDKYTRVVYPKLIPAVIKWGKVVAHKFYKLGKSEKLINASVCSEKPNDHSEWNDFEIRLMDCMLAAQQYRQGSINLDIVKPWAEELSELIEQPKQKWSE